MSPYRRGIEDLLRVERDQEEHRDEGRTHEQHRNIPPNNCVLVRTDTALTRPRVSLVTAESAACRGYDFVRQGGVGRCGGAGEDEGTDHLAEHADG